MRGGVITYHINTKRNFTDDRDNLILLLHKRILFVTTPNSLAVASLDFFCSAPNNVQFERNIVAASPRHCICTTWFFCSVGGIKKCGGEDLATIQYRAFINYFTRHTPASKRNRAYIPTRPLLG